ncbi:MAG: shikimate dehydrogenase [Anaerolineae bacterium]|nr:shikimate dehydrogenase [Anaerolineae bacterium]
MIDGQTRLVGVIGWPIAHSLSPTMHNAAFDALGLNWRYLAFPVLPGQVGEAIAGLRALGFRGVNVTVPHKEAVIPYLDAIPARVRQFGAVNTVIVDRDAEGACALRGENTDVEGFAYALREGGFEPQGRRVLVVGAGGGARGVVYGLCGAGAARVSVLNRTPERAARLVEDLAPGAGSTRLRWGALTPDALVRAAQEADLLVNTTTLGMWPHVEASIWPDDRSLPAHLAVCDLVYRPLETRLLRQARAAGAPAIDGLGMLIAQGALSFEMWTGQWPPADVMRAACEAALDAPRGDEEG